ncbi:hypothetical protein BRC81_16300 [Halobacteriales archaeon QS_1_68_20]|nr:MAG: hypothetical protein BRC81_16300 [Halobacteriales archaeon QS_1_68_20]
MSLLARLWRQVRQPLSYATVILGSVLGITALGMVTRGMVTAESVPFTDLTVTFFGAILLIGVGIGLQWRAPG